MGCGTSCLGIRFVSVDKAFERRQQPVPFVGERERRSRTQCGGRRLGSLLALGPTCDDVREKESNRLPNDGRNHLLDLDFTERHLDHRAQVTHHGGGVHPSPTCQSGLLEGQNLVPVERQVLLIEIENRHGVPVSQRTGYRALLWEVSLDQGRCRRESRHGTQECVRHVLPSPTSH